MKTFIVTMRTSYSKSDARDITVLADGYQIDYGKAVFYERVGSWPFCVRAKIESFNSSSWERIREA